MERLQATLIVSERPNKSFDEDATNAAVRPSVDCEDSEELLNNVSELFGAPLLTQTH